MMEKHDDMNERIETTMKSDEKWNELTRIKLKTVN